MSSLNYGELCRLCLVKESVSIPIFDGEGDVRRLFLKIAACLPVKVSREDRLPKKICDDCLYKLENQYSFWNSTANAEKQLLQWYDVDSLQDEKKIVPTTNLETEQLDLKQEIVDPDQGSELAKSLSRVEAVLADDAAGRTAPNTQEEEEEEEESEEEVSNSEESEEDDDNDNDNDADEPSKDDNESDENYEELEPTTFVNVSLACDEAGPSGMQQQQQQQQQQTSAPSTSTSGPAASGWLTAVNPARTRDVPDMNHLLNDVGPSLVYNGPVIKGCGQREPAVNPARTRDVPDMNHFLNDVGPSLVYNGPVLKDSGQREGYQHACNQCHLKFPNKHDLICHKRIIHHQNIINYFCDNCDFSTFSRITMIRHKKQHVKLDTLKCDICNKRGFSKFEFHKHKATHKGPFLCTVCNKSFLHVKNMRVHMAEQHDPTFKRSHDFQCELCGKAFTARSSLAAHRLHHTQPRAHVCDVCGKCVTTKTSLAVHRRTHTGERPLVCKVCGKTFNSPSSLVCHRRAHDGLKPYRCDECGKCFTQRSTLVVHIRYHSGVRPYGCELCDKGFVTKTLATAHEKTHSQLA